MNKHQGQDIKEHLYEVLRKDDLAVYHYIKNTDPSDSVTLALVINEVVSARTKENKSKESAPKETK